MKIAVLAGDGIGPEIVAQAVKVLGALKRDGLALELEQAPFGGAGFDAHGDPLPETDAQARAGKPTPCCAGRSAARNTTRCRARSARSRGYCASARSWASSRTCARRCSFRSWSALDLKPEVVSGLDIMIIRELTGDIYFGEPRGRRENARGEREGYDTMLYSEPEIRRIAEVGFADRVEARQEALLGGQGERARDEPLLARSGERRGEEVPGRSRFRTCTSTTPRCSSCAIRSSST